MASPDRIRNIHVAGAIEPRGGSGPPIAAISQEKARMMIVLNAVATAESVFLMPHFARIEVIPAKNAERNASTIHMLSDDSTNDAIVKHCY